MKVVRKIHQAIVKMYEARNAWEVAKAKAEGEAKMDEGYTAPKVQYLPGVGFSINGVEWRYTSAYIIDHFDKMTADYRIQTQLYEAQSGTAEGAALDTPDIPF